MNVTDDPVITRTGCTTSGVGGKDYYPSIGEPLEAGPDQFRPLTGKLNKDWLIFLLKDAIEHLKQVKSSNSLLASNIQKLDHIKSACLSPIASNPQVSLSSPSSWSDVVKKSLNEHDYDVAKAEVLEILEVSSSVVLRANRFGKSNTNKDFKLHPIEIKLTSTNDKKMNVPKVSLLKGSEVFDEGSPESSFCFE